MKTWRLIRGVSLVLFSMFICWSVAFLIVSLLSDNYSKQNTWNKMLERGQTVEALNKSSGGNTDTLMKQISQLDHDHLALFEQGGRVRYYGTQPEKFTEELDQADVDSVLAGEIVKKKPWQHPLEAGLAITGQLVQWDGQTYALFLMKRTPSIFAGYWKLTLTHVLAFVIILICGALLGPRQKQVHLLKSMVDAMRRMAKGDFNVNLETHPRFREFGVLVEGLNHMAVELSQMEKMRQEFISNVSHEIQSPLTSISGFSRALQNESLTFDERLHYLGIIETESFRLSKLSDNLLKLTSLESAHHPFEAKTYRLDKQLRNIVLACEPQWQDKEIDMDIHLDELSLVADEDLMSQVWINLINNSIKFTPHKGTIGIHLQLRDKVAEVRIWDTGTGISKEDQNHIFERFYKADKSRNRKNSGSGLGLSIVSKILDIHHASIRVESELGHGATFIIHLPLTRPEAVPL
ncbi:sensor histidine kinase [Paenibacillus eucommiae]|uniref:histidine kinase n=1 Tax=Paenibacillus eucommiae TaxID=1355755 RepID=A0ABS4JB41_9BACL|nr:HAMP domain-containing sensor histidine kinase [Paenibacillus eucommiae]MBP1997074.1 signal transduction histidine kinase [Paenibacillus eucommiae]